MWDSYSSMILFFGAEFIKQHVVYNGRKIKPAADTVMIVVAVNEKKK